MRRVVRKLIRNLLIVAGLGAAVACKSPINGAVTFTTGQNIEHVIIGCGIQPVERDPIALTITSDGFTAQLKNGSTMSGDWNYCTVFLWSRTHSGGGQ